MLRSVIRQGDQHRLRKGRGGARGGDGTAAGERLLIESLGVGLGRYARLDLPVLLLGGGRSPAHLRKRLDALAAVLPRLEEVVVLEKQGHMANLRAPGQVADVIAAFADRLGL